MAPSATSAAAHGAGPEPREPVEETYSFPLSAQQRGLWFVQQFDPRSAAFNMPLVLQLHGDLDEAALARALSEIVRRHEMLRTTFALVDEEPRQQIHPPRPVHLPCVELSGLAERAREALLPRLRREERERPVDLERGPLLRVRLLRLGERLRELHLVTHHIVHDGWSEGLLLRELTLLYEACRQGRRSPLPELPVQYADYTLWQQEWLRSDALATQLEYWRGRLADLPALDLPRDPDATPQGRGRGEMLPFTLSVELSRELRQLARREGVTLFVALLAGFKLLLSRLSGQTDVAVATVVANRNPRETEGLIGCFVNNLVLRTDLGGRPSFRQLLKRVAATTLEAYEHQDVPFDRLVEELNPERSGGAMPLVQAVFVFQNTPDAELRLGDLRLEPIATEYGYAFEELCLSMHEEGEALAGSLNYATELCARGGARRVLSRFERLLADACAAPELGVERLALLTSEERTQVLGTWSAGARLPVPAASVQALFERQVERAPDATAVVDGGRSLGYGELNREANRLAHHLRALGVGPDTLVGICARRSLDQMVALLGVLKAGGAYLPLDPDLPRERLAFMLDDARPALVLTQAPLREHLPPGGVPLFCLDTQRAELQTRPTRDPEPRTSSSHLAYVIYTSGSTGRPKGVMVTHGSLVNHAFVSGAHFGLTPADRVLQFASLAFDASAEEIFTCLAHGATLVLRDDRALGAPATFLDACREWAISVLDLPTAYWHELVDALLAERLELPASLRLVILGGEAARPELVHAWSERVGGALRLVNTYGPTEATIVAASCELSHDGHARHAASPVPIGAPIANACAYVVDRELQPVPPGVYGEIVVGGAGVARGYLGRPELTAERFVPDPFASARGARLYRTGDIGRWLAGGALEFRGRADGQVKLRGFRVELGEIEAVLREHPAVEQCAVLVREARRGDPRLAAYVVCRAGHGATSTELREWLRTRVPEYMLPAWLGTLDALPKTVSGKLDRQALQARAPEERLAGGHPTAPRSPSEELLAGIWAEVLGLEQVGVHDSFFELGGHSLLAVKLMARLRERFGAELALSVFFERPTVAAVAAALDAPVLRRDGPLVALRPQGERPPLFLVHAGGGGLFAYRELARALPARRPLYGFERPGFESGEVEFLDVEPLAARYLEPLRRHQPRGPYALAGWSFGGLVAFELARQLEQAGERVAFLGLIDTPPPLGRAQARLHALASRVGLTPDGSLDRELRALGQAPDPGAIERLRAVLDAHLRALRRYAPRSGVSAERVVLFHAAESADGTRGVEQGAAWQALSRHPLERQTVAGDHYTIMERPGVALLADALARALGDV